jgi:hypothetical protein
LLATQIVWSAIKRYRFLRPFGISDESIAASAAGLHETPHTAPRLARLVFDK